MKAATSRSSRPSVRGRKGASFRASTRRTRPVLLILGGLLAAGGAAVWFNDSVRPNPAPMPRAVPKPAVIEKELMAEPTLPPPAPKTPVVKTPTRVSREELARQGLSRVQEFEGLAADDAARKIARLEAFIKEYPDTFAAARATALVKSLRVSSKTEE